MLHLTVPQEELSRSLFTTMNATNDILSYMSSGVFAEWNEMVQSNKNTKGKSTSTNTGMHVIEFFFCFPSSLVVSRNANQSFPCSQCSRQSLHLLFVSLGMSSTSLLHATSMIMEVLFCQSVPLLVRIITIKSPHK